MLTAILCFFGSEYVLNQLRGEFMGVQQRLEAMKPATVVIEGSTPAQSVPAADEQIITNFHRRSARLTSVLLFLAAAGTEITGAFAFYEAISRFPAFFILVTQTKLRRVRRRMARCASQIEEWKQAPEIARDEFTRGALMGEPRIEEDHPKEFHQLSPGLGLLMGLLSFALLFALLLFFMVRDSSAQEVVVTAVDLTESSVGVEHRANVRAVPEIISALKSKSRFAVIPITERSFSEPTILDARLTSEPGLFGERLKSGKREIIHVWDERTKALKAGAKQTDIFGALAKASIIFEESPNLRPELVLLSDMRQDHGGYFFEGQPKIPPETLDRVSQDGLIPSLKGVRVWVLGAHAQGVSQIYWMSLRSFWAEYFMRAGAKLVIYTPNRRWTNE